MRTMMRALASLALVLAMAGPGRAAGPGLPTAIRVEAGFDGLAKAGKWVPVAVTLKNDGAEFTGELRFESKSQFGPAPQTTIYRTPVVIPAGGTKRVQLHMPLEGVGVAAPAITLAAKGGGQSAAVPLKLESGWDTIIGVLGVEPEELKGLAGMKHGSQAVRLARLEPGNMPAEALELENLDALLLDRFAWSELPEPQRQAIQAWVEHGGTLIAAGGPEAKRLEGLASWAPLTVKGVQSAAINGVGPAQIAQFDLSRGGWQVGRSAGTLPLTARLQKGGGSIQLLAFDPALEPFASSSSLPGLFEGLLPPAQVNAGMGGKNPGAMKAQYVLMDALVNFPLEQAPASKGLLIMLGIYAVLIGPAQFLLLRGFRRLGWALLSLPLVAAVGAGGAWAYAREVKRSDVMMNVISLIQGQPDGHFLKVNSLAGIHMPPQASHEVLLGGALLQAVARPPMPGPNGVMPQAPAGTTVEQGHAARLAPLDEWQMRGVAAEGMLPVAGTVSAAVTITDQRAEGRLTSRLPFALKDALVVAGTGFQKIGDLNPGVNVDLSVALPVVAQESRGGNNMLADAISRAYQSPGFGPGAQTRDQFMMMIRQQLGWAAINAVGGGDSNGQSPLVLVGWAERPPLPIAVDQRQLDATGLGLYIQPLPFSFGRGAMTVSSGFLPARVSQWSGTGPFPGLDMGWSLARDQWVTVDFDMPGALAGRLDQAEAKVPSLKQGANAKSPISIAYYRWSDAAWVESATDNAGARPVTGSAFVSPAGTVRIRITQVGQQQWPLGVPSLVVRVKEAQP